LPGTHRNERADVLWSFYFEKLFHQTIIRRPLEPGAGDGRDPPETVDLIRFAYEKAAHDV